MRRLLRALSAFRLVDLNGVQRRTLQLPKLIILHHKHNLNLLPRNRNLSNKGSVPPAPAQRFRGR